MGDALSKPAEPWEDELPASPPQQQVPPADAAAEQPTPGERRRVKVKTPVGGRMWSGMMRRQGGYLPGSECDGVSPPLAPPPCRYRVRG